MIDKADLWPRLLKATPSFQSDFDQQAPGDAGLDYIIAANYARHLLTIYSSDETKVFSAISYVIERMISQGDTYVSEFAIIGLLEDILFTWQSADRDQENFAQYLLPLSLAYWKSIAKFWSGEIAYIGADISRDDLT